MTRRPRPALVAGLAALALAGACGGGGDDEGASQRSEGKQAPAANIGDATSNLDVQAGDIFFKPKSFEAPSGTITVNYLNTGSLLHTLKIDGEPGTVEKAFKLSVPGKGDTDTSEIRLPPGEYVLYCDVPGHRAANMEASLVVK